MCGRTACTLNPDTVSKSCRYRTKDGSEANPSWVKNKDKYIPSHNKAPQSYCPVLLGGNHFQREDEKLDWRPAADERVLAGMRWGLIPNWFKGEDVAKVSYNMNNARSDTLMEKRSYSGPLRKGQRCVVVVEGFYEWNATPSGKQPYYIYFPNSQRGGSKANSENDPSDSGVVKDEIPGRLLTMAGIFEKTYHDGEDVFSFTVITVNAHPSFSWLHHRMPAMLVDDDEVTAWLDCENVPLQEALELIKPKDCLRWHPVSKYVGNSRNNGPECWEEVDPQEVEKANKPKFAAESKSMMRWLSSGSKKKPLSEENSSPKKHRAPGSPMDKFVKRMKKSA